MRPILLCLILSACSSLHPMYENGKHELSVAEKGGVSVLIRGRQIGIRKEF